MKKATKILTLILIVVLVLSVFAGCSLVGRNVAAYRSAVAFRIGDDPDKAEVITIGKLLDTYNNYYNNYYYYINMGYLDASQLLNMVMSSLIQQYMQVADYVANNSVATPSLAGKAHNAEYLTQDQFDYALKYVNYLAFQAFDQYLDENISGKYELNEAETEDTSRDFTEYDDISKPDGTSYENYVEYTFAQNFINKDADEYFEKYYPADFDLSKINVDGYVYAADSEFVKKHVEEYNERLTDDEVEAEHSLTVEEYIEIQQDTIKQYEETIQNSYGISLLDFLQNQLDDMVTSCIVAKWNYNQYKDIENGLEDTLQANYTLKKNAQVSDFAINDNFDGFITGLSSSSNIFTLPEEEADNYIFVKNILIPFTSAQTALLSAKLAEFGGDDEDPRYTEYRNAFAAQIVAEYFDSDKYTETDEGKTFEETYFAKDKWFEDKKKSADDDSLWKTKEGQNPFKADESGNLIVNPDSVLGQFLQDGTVKDIDGKEHSDIIVELMKRFNTDTAQHTAAFDYVVYVGDDWEDYSHSWVKEFYTAVNKDLAPHDGSPAKEYTLCVSTYGVHIIYKSGNLSDKLYDFDYSKRLDTANPNYTFFKSYFEAQVSNKRQDGIEQLQKSKFGDGTDASKFSNYIVLEKAFDRFLDDNEFEFDLNAFVEELMAEL